MQLSAFAKEAEKKSILRIFRYFQLPTLKLAVEEIESNEEDGEPVYQNQKVQFYSMEKRFI